MTSLLVLYLALGALSGLVMLAVRRSRTHRGVSPANGEPEDLRAFFRSQLSGAGWEVDEYELVDGGRLTAVPPPGNAGRRRAAGLLLAASGLFPAVAWFAMGPSRVVVTVKAELGFLVVIVETAGRPAQRLWRRINLRLTRRTLSGDAWPDASGDGLTPGEAPGLGTPPR
jgi:hypothetical protein